MIHILPVNDLKIHIDKSTCECKPKIISRQINGKN
jgi:hypothetical protein